MANKNVSLLLLKSKFDEKSAKETANQAKKSFDKSLKDVGDISISDNLADELNNAITIINGRLRNVDTSSFSNDLLETLVSKKSIDEKTKAIENFIELVGYLKDATTGNEQALDLLSTRQLNTIIRKEKTIAELKNNKIHSQENAYKEANKLAKPSRSLKQIEETYGTGNYLKQSKKLKKTFFDENESSNTAFNDEQKKSIESLSQMLGLYQAMQKTKPDIGSKENITYTKDLLTLVKEIKTTSEQIDLFSDGTASKLVNEIVDKRYLNTNLTDIDNSNILLKAIDDYSTKNKDVIDIQTKIDKTWKEINDYIANKTNKAINSMATTAEKVVSKAQKESKKVQDKLGTSSNNNNQSNDGSIVGVDNTDLLTLDEIEKRLKKINESASNGNASNKELKEYIQLYKQYLKLIENTPDKTVDNVLQEEYNAILSYSPEFKRYADQLDIETEKGNNNGSGGEKKTTYTIDAEQAFSVIEDIKVKLGEIPDEKNPTIKIETSGEDVFDRLENINESSNIDNSQVVEQQNKIQEGLKENQKQAEQTSEATNKIIKGDSVKLVAFHGTNLKWDTDNFDFSRSGKRRSAMGTGMYFTTNADSVSDFGKAEVKELDKNLNGIFIITKDYITNIEDLYKAMNQEVPDNVNSIKAMGDIRRFNNASKENSDLFRANMLSMGYKGTLVGDNINNIRHPEEIVIYDENELKDLKSFTNNEFKELHKKGNIEIHISSNIEDITKEIEEASILPTQDAPQPNAESSGTKDISSATEEAAQSNKDFANTNEEVQLSVDGSKSFLEQETDLMQSIADNAQKAAEAKKEFAEANSKVSDSTKETTEQLDIEADKISEVKNQANTSVQTKKFDISADEFSGMKENPLSYFSKVYNSVDKMSDTIKAKFGKQGFTDIEVSGIETLDKKIEHLTVTARDASGVLKTFEYDRKKIEGQKNAYLIANENVKVNTATETNSSNIIVNIEGIEGNTDALTKNTEALNKNTSELQNGVRLSKSDIDLLNKSGKSSNSQENSGSSDNSEPSNVKKYKKKDVNSNNTSDNKLTPDKKNDLAKELKAKQSEIIATLDATTTVIKEITDFYDSNNNLVKTQMKVLDKDDNITTYTTSYKENKDGSVDTWTSHITTEKFADTRKDLENAWDEANKINNALNETQNKVSSLSQMPELSSQFTDVEKEVKLINQQLTSGELTLSEYKKAINEICNGYSKMVSIQQKRDKETYDTRNKENNEVADEKRKFRQDEKQSEQSAVNKALKDQLAAWQKIQSIREKIEKSNSPEEIAVLQEVKKYYQEQYISANKILKAHSDLYDKEGQTLKLEQIRLETNASIAKYKGNKEKTSNDANNKQINKAITSTNNKVNLLSEKQELSSQFNNIIKQIGSYDSQQIKALPDLTEEFQNVKKQIDALNKDLTSGRITLEDYNNSVESIITNYNNLVEVEKQISKEIQNTKENQLKIGQDFLQEQQDYLSTTQENEAVQKNKNVYQDLIDTIKEYSNVRKRLASNKALDGDVELADKLENKIYDLQNQGILSSSQIDKSNRLLDELYNQIIKIEKEVNRDNKSLVTSFYDNLNVYEGRINKAKNSKSYDKGSKYDQAVQDYDNAFQKYRNAVTNANNLEIVDEDTIENIKQLKKAVDDLAVSLQYMDKGSIGLTRGKVIDRINKYMDNNPAISKEYKYELEQLLYTLKNMGSDTGVQELLTQFYDLKIKIHDAGQEGKTFFDIIKDKATYGLAAQIGMYFGLNDIIRYIQEGINVVKELDTAFTEMRKVSDETVNSLKDFQQASFDVAKQIGTTALEVQNSAADFMRLGYALEEASQLSVDANIYANVGDMDISEATEHMVSSIQAWQSEFSSTAEASTNIIDRYNEVGNNFAITSADIGSAMERSAAALKAAGNNLNESIGLIVAGNLIQQDADTTANALKVLSLRIRGAKADLTSMNEETDGLVDSTSKLREQIKALTGVDIMLDENTYKSTAEIIQELGAVWDKLTDVSKSATLEILAGKTRASTIAGLIENYKTIGSVIESAENSAGSAREENLRYVESIEGRLSILSTQAQEFWYTFIDSSAIKNGITLLTNLLDVLTKLVDTFGSLGTVATIGGGILGAKSMS